MVRNKGDYMVKVLFGNKGMGKTKVLVQKANELSEENKNSVIYIDDSNDRLFDLKHQVRLINISEYAVESSESFFGFLCGIAASNYDVNSIIIDGMNYFINQDISTLKEFFINLEKFSKKQNIDFFISISSNSEMIPEFLSEYSLH
jgi:thymidine kinase